MTYQERSNTGTCISDSTEQARRKRLEQLNTAPGSRESLEAVHGQVWDTSELQRDFMVIGFLAPFVHVCRKIDQEEGSLEYQHQPRFYFNFRSANR